MALYAANNISSAVRNFEDQKLCESFWHCIESSKC